MYSIIRFFMDEDIPNEVLKRGVTLEEARQHCWDKQTSSRSCTDPELVQLTEDCGPWFDGYEEE